MEVLQASLDEFRCYRDGDVEAFLRKKAINFVKQEICSVYLFLDADLFDEKIIAVDAYFTLSHKALELISDLSSTTKKKIATSKNAEITSVVLIGQLAKYMSLDDNGKENIISELSSKEILDYAMEIIIRASELIVCRALLIETKFEEKLYSIYEKYGFHFLQENPYRDLKQFYMRLKFEQ